MKEHVARGLLLRAIVMIRRAVTESIAVGRGFEREPDVILPVQLLARRGEVATGERALMLAVLEDAIHCFQKYRFVYHRGQRRLAIEAAEWIWHRDQSEPFSFENLCHALDLDPDFLRQGLRQWERRQARRMLTHPASHGHEQPRRPLRPAGRGG